MKKKLLAILLVLVMACSFVLTACDTILKVNEERDFAQVVATVTVTSADGRTMSGDITKIELQESFYNTGYMYVYYYSMEVEDVMELMLTSLVQSKMTVLNAKLHYAQAMNLPSEAKAMSMLSNLELDYAIKEVNEDFQEQFDTFVAEIEEEKALANGTADEDDDADDDEDEADEDDFVEETLTARATKTESEEAEAGHEGHDHDVIPDFSDEEPITLDQVAKKFFDTLDVKNDSTKAEAKRRLQKALEESYRDFDYYLEKQSESIVVEKYKRDIVQGAVTVSEDEITTRYNKYLADNHIAYTASTRSAFETAIADDMTKVVYQPFNDYGYVLQILMKFSDDQSAEITNYAYANAEQLTAFTNKLARSITVNISNPDYDAEGECIDEDYDVETGDKNITANPAKLADGESYTRLQIINQHACDEANCPLKAYTELDVPVQDVLNRIGADLVAATTPADKLKAFEKWIYMVNDDTGMMNAGTWGYLINPNSTTYVDSFTALGRAIVLKDEGTSALTDEEITALQTADTKGSDSIVQFVLADGSKLTYCVSTYGIHIMICSGNGITSADVTAGTYTDTIPLDFVVDAYNGLTLHDSIAKTLKTEKVSDSYTAYVSNLYTNNNGATEKNEKLYEKIIEELQEMYGQAAA